MSYTKTINADCMDILPDMADNEFDLAVVDPPYGIGEDGKKNHSRSKIAVSSQYKSKDWDKQSMSQDYFKQILRVSKNQIIFGANHFISKIAIDSSCWIIWDKDNGATDFADAEIAWTSFKSAVRIFKYRWQGMLQQNPKNKEIRIHPTQKPVALYKWILRTYAKKGEKILDTHLGSGSSRIAADDLGFEFLGIEKDNDYFIEQEQRFEKYKAQLKLFA